MSNKNLMLKIVLPFLILLVGGGGAFVLIKGRKPPTQVVVENPGALVHVISASRGDHRLAIRGTGTVQPREAVALSPQIDGRVVHVAPNLVAGGFFKKDELLFAIEEVDYQLAVERAEANLSKAELDLETVRAQAEIAAAEWKKLKRDADEKPNDLLLYRPQLKNAEATLASGKASLEQARLDLKRTRMVAPFNCYVRSKQVDLGQYVRSGTTTVELVGTDLAEIIVPLAPEELQWLDIPRQGAGVFGSAATISIRAGAQTHTWEGHIVRSLGEVDSRGRMARVAVAVEDPYGLQLPEDDRRPDLSMGSFVEVSLYGKQLNNVVQIPRGALREGDTVWTVNADNLLEIVPVKILRREPEFILLNDGLNGGERLILTSLSGAANGMKLRPAEEGQ